MEAAVYEAAEDIAMAMEGQFAKDFDGYMGIFSEEVEESRLAGDEASSPEAESPLWWALFETWELHLMSDDPAIPHSHVLFTHTNPGLFQPV